MNAIRGTIAHDSTGWFLKGEEGLPVTGDFKTLADLMDWIYARPSTIGTEKPLPFYTVDANDPYSHA